MKIILVLGFLFGLNANLSAQNIKLTESELNSVLCKRWEIEFAIMGAMKIKQIPGATDFDFLFKKDGEYDLIEDDGTTKTGIWKYDTDSNYVEMSIDGKITSRIKNVNKYKLILIMVSRKNDSPVLPNIEVHFKPI